MITFDVQGAKLLTPYKLETNGAFQITPTQGEKILYNSSLTRVQGCYLTNNSMGESIHILANPAVNGFFISTSCSILATNNIDVMILPSGDDIGHFHGPVECS